MSELRSVVLAELEKGTHTEAFADGARWAVQEAEKRMPTREQIAEALREACSVDSGQTVTWEDAADAVLALLNGTES